MHESVCCQRPQDFLQTNFQPILVRLILGVVPEWENTQWLVTVCIVLRNEWYPHTWSLRTHFCPDSWAGKQICSWAQVQGLIKLPRSLLALMVMSWHLGQWRIQHRNPTVKISTRQGKRKTQGFPGMRGEDVKREWDGEDWVENGGKHFLGCESIFSLFTTAQKTQKSPEESKLPFDLGKPSPTLVRVHPGPVCPPWGPSFWPYPHLWADLLFSHRTAGRRFIWRSGRRWPSHPQETWAFQSGKGPPSLSFKGIKRQLQIFSSFIFEIANIFHFLQMQDRGVLFQSHSQD